MELDKFGNPLNPVKENRDRFGNYLDPVELAQELSAVEEPLGFTQRVGQDFDRRKQNNSTNGRMFTPSSLHK